MASAWQDTIPRTLNQIGLGLLATFPAFTVPLLVLSKRPSIQVVIAIPCLWAALSWLAVETVLALYTNETRDKVALDVVYLQLGAATYGFLSALTVRVAGYRLSSYQ